MPYRLPNGQLIDSFSTNTVIPETFVIKDNRNSWPHLTAKSILLQNAQDNFVRGGRLCGTVAWSVARNCGVRILKNKRPSLEKEKRSWSFGSGGDDRAAKTARLEIWISLTKLRCFLKIKLVVYCSSTNKFYDVLVCLLFVCLHGFSLGTCMLHAKRKKKKKGRNKRGLIGRTQRNENYA